MGPQFPHLLGMLPFMAAKGFQRPVFPVQEEEVVVPTVQEHLRCIKEVWGTVNASLHRSGICAWLNCSLQHQTTNSRNRSPRFIGLFMVDKVMNPKTFRLELPPSLNIDTVCHDCLFKPIWKYLSVNLLPQRILQRSGPQPPTSCRLGGVRSGGELLDFVHACFRSWLDCFIFSLCFRSRGWRGSLWIPLDTAAHHWGAIRGILTTLHVSAGSCQNFSAFIVAY